ncbi:MAG: insulinase family protein [Bacteroides sp.]|nr:insulinase family protein [Bacteroides sp.]
MFRKILSLTLMLWYVFTTQAQQPLPLNPQVRHGVLPNGLTYYILHNEEPRNRANFYIAQKVGSALETPEQYGLAHFLEHMAFNGTTHYPGDSMLRYLESKGIRFGVDINAYTDYEETVYNIDNVPTDNTVLMDSVLLVLRDWSCDLLLEDEEIDAERKVIQEEWRMRNDPSYRFRAAMAPKIFAEPQYHLTPIGTMEVVMNFPYKALRDYYHKWYRPDQQGIIIVGDFNAEEMEKRVVEMFSSIPMPENAAPREYVHVSDNEKPLFFAFEDPELKNGRVDFQVKFDKIPLEYQNTDMAFINSLIQDIIAEMINTRLYEHTLDADCKYANAGVYFADMYPSKTKGIFNVAAIAKDNELEAFEDAFQIVMRACRTGFSQSELDRAIENMKSQYDQRFNERNSTNTSRLAKELINAFKDNVPAMGIEAERDFFNSFTAQVPVEAYNQAATQIITPNNQVVLIQQQKKDGKMLPSEQETLAVVNDVLNRQYEAYIDEVVSEPLITVLPVKGKIAKIEEGKFGTTEIMLSNGVKVILKPTDYKDDEILFQAFKNGGKIAYSYTDAVNVQMIGDAVGMSNMGSFDNKTLVRYLTGKNVSMEFSIGQFTDNLRGNSSVKDLPTLFELIYTAFTNVNANEENYNNYIARIIPQLEAAEKSPEFVFGQHRDKALYSGNPMQATITADLLKTADYGRILQIYKEAVANPADYTFLFTGNVDIEIMKPLLEQYIASLPTSKKRESKVVTPINTSDGQVVDNYSIEMTTPGDWLYGFYSGTNIEGNIQNQVKTSLVGDVLGIIYTEILREKEGGVYSPMVYSSYDINTGKWNLVYFLQTNEEQSAQMLNLADELFVKLLKEGATADQFNRVKGALLSQYENTVRTNSYWHNNIRLYNLLGNDFITDHRNAIENLTLNEFNDFMRNLYDGKNRIQVNMHGVSAIAK